MLETAKSSTASINPFEVALKQLDEAAKLIKLDKGLHQVERTVNGQPGLVAQRNGVTEAVMAFDVAGDRITRIWAVRNPEKLRPWTVE